jgi:hypothetical protein
MMGMMYRYVLLGILLFGMKWEAGRNHNIYSIGIYLLGIGYDNDR